ncbi:hypothetical protein Efla_005526 [Eimeria flavescens]
MEKYRIFSDETTGCQPFVPTYYSQKQLLGSGSRSRIVGCLLYCLKLPLQLLLLLLAAARVLLLAFSLLVAALVTLLLLPLRFLPCLSDWPSSPSASTGSLKRAQANYRRLRVRPPAQRQSPPYSSFLSLAAGGGLKGGGPQGPSFGGLGGPSHAALCLSSFTSFAEPLYLQMRLNPLFVLLHADGSLSLVGLWGAIRHALSFELAPGRGRFASLSALLLSLESMSSSSSSSSSSRTQFIPPVVVFPEGQKSNGCCLLQWDPKAADAAAVKGLRGRIALLGCLYTTDARNPASTAGPKWREPAYTPPHTVNSPLRHLLLLLLQPRQCMRCIWVSPEDVLASQQQQQQQQQQQIDELQCLRTILLRAVPSWVGVGKQGRDLKAFNEYWNQQQQQQQQQHRKKL